MGLNPFSDYDPYEKIEYLEAYLNNQAEVIQKLGEQNANAMWMITQINRHLADLTQTLNQLADYTKKLKTRIDHLEDLLE
jgi:uncharacterized coiled-coil protein SlyX